MGNGWIRRLQRTLLVSPEALAADARLAARTLDPDAVCEVAGVRRLAELGPRSTRIIDSEQLLDPTERLVVLRDAVEQGVRMLFVESSSPAEAELTDALPGIVRRLDDGTAPDAGSLHGIAVTALLQHCLASDPERTSLALTGMPTRHMDGRALALLPATLDVRRAHPLRRLVGDPRVPVYLAVGIYSALRALPVALIPQFHGSLLMLWLIDVVTAVPYTWGVLAMLFAPRRGIRMLATLTTVTTFAAPYVYFWMHGRDYPLYVVIVIAALTAASILIEVVKYLQEQGLRRRYADAMAPAARLVTV
ncbi:hypothetical protein QF046_000052 [Microbacterium sp. W4I4]|uniref:hypothetical protein n=1 Tax=Microbacterium sp. W4I4 TaxID=3042295 RepID=UPI00278A5BE1|nr:hypothetical protein [Microbacterium sp. W4I4]MDQ0612411.1 hypothetical protein [Microbacterium sp. W4I4]